MAIESVTQPDYCLRSTENQKRIVSHLIPHLLKYIGLVLDLVVDQYVTAKHDVEFTKMPEVVKQV